MSEMLKLRYYGKMFNIIITSTQKIEGAGNLKWQHEVRDTQIQELFLKNYSQWNLEAEST